MDGDVELLKRIYDRFNARDIDGVLIGLTDRGRLGQRYGWWLRPWP